MMEDNVIEIWNTQSQISKCYFPSLSIAAATLISFDFTFFWLMLLLLPCAHPVFLSLSFSCSLDAHAEDGKYETKRIFTARWIFVLWKCYEIYDAFHFLLLLASFRHYVHTLILYSNVLKHIISNNIPAAHHGICVWIFPNSLLSIVF